MGIKDELQSEVDKIRARENEQRALTSEQNLYYREQQQPVMLSCKSYFLELADQLGIVDPDIVVHYPFDPFVSEGVSFKQGSYRVRPDRDIPRQIDILCSCELEKPSEFYLDSVLKADTHAKFLDGYNFAYHRKNRLDKFYNPCGATFYLEGPLVARIRITADSVEQCIRVELRNFFQDPDPRYHRFSTESFNEDVMERLAQLLLRKIPFLSESKVSESYRDQLRSQLEDEQAQRDEDMARAQAEREEEERLAEEAKPINRAKRKLRELGNEATVALTDAAQKAQHKAQKWVKRD
jgi:hypothetical protein